MGYGTHNPLFISFNFKSIEHTYINPPALARNRPLSALHYFQGFHNPANRGNPPTHLLHKHFHSFHQLIKVETPLNVYRALSVKEISPLLNHQNLYPLPHFRNPAPSASISCYLSSLIMNSHPSEIPCSFTLIPTHKACSH